MNIPRIVLFPEVKEFFVEKKYKDDKSYFIDGRILENENVYHIKNIYEENNEPMDLNQIYPKQNIGKILIGLTTSSSSSLPSRIEFEIVNKIIFTLSTDELIYKRRLSISGKYFNTEGKYEPIELDLIISDLSRLYNRINSLSEYPLKTLNTKKIAIIGLGSGGSLIALSLAKAGIQNFLFVDSDIYEDHNIIRHICPLKDLGRFKTHAVKDYLLERIPDLNISTIDEAFKIDTQSDEESYRSDLKDFDLLISATGDHKINFRINQFAYRFGIPVIYAGTFNKITGGIMIRVDPTKGDVCYNCIYGKNRKEQLANTTPNNNSNDNENTNNDNNNNNEEIPNIIASEQSITYDRNLEDLLSQPGLGIDIDNITIFVVKFILSNLLENTSDHTNSLINNTSNNNLSIHTNGTENKEYTLYNFPYAIYVWYNRDITNENNKKSKEGLELYYYDNSEMSNYSNKRKDCPICGFESQKQLL